jgi:protein-disulfide isomerase
MYKVVTKYQGNDIDVYITKDGKWLFVSSPIDTAVIMTTTTTQPAKTCADITKADKATMEAFVVSYCPYGLQMQRILAEVVKNIPTLADSIKVRYIGSVSNGKVTSMHGDAEATENLRQICIREEQPDKYWNYVSCFMKKQDSADNCLTEAGVDKSKLSICMADGGKGVDYAKADFALQDTYGVSGSPTLILNGEKVSEFDFGGRTADALKTLICCGFNTQPSGCSTKLSTAQAATSFSETYSGSASTSGNSTC